MRVCIVMTLFVGLALVGCKKDGGEAGAAGGATASPEALGKALIEGFNSGDAKAVKALFATDELMKKAMTCSDNKRVERVARQRDKIAKELEGDLKGVKFEWLGIKDRKEKAFAKGDKDSDCTYNEAVTMKKVKLKFKMSKDGKTEEESEGVTMVKVGDGGWYLVKL